MSEELISQLSLAFGSLVSALVAYAVMLIRSKVQNDNASAILVRLTHATELAVREVQQTTVKQLKKAAKDGKLTEDELDEARSAAAKSVKGYLGPKGIGELKKVAGDDLEVILKRAIEAQVNKMKGGN